AQGDNGDTGEEYGRLLVAIVVALVAAVIWTIADRGRRARWVEGGLRVLLRYSIALGLASYAIAKVLPVQFSPLRPVLLEMRVGELSPMGLLWRFMQYSRAYSTCAGVLELLVVVLLCFRRTATLGALLCLPVMANVALMNLCSGVPVKLYSLMIFLSAIVIVTYDAPALLAVLVHHRATPATPIGPPFRSRRLNQMRWAVKLLVVGGVIASSLYEMRQSVAWRAQTAPIHGTWNVESLVKGGRELVGTADPARWRRVAASNNSFAIRLESDELLSCRPHYEEASATIKLVCKDGHTDELLWRHDGDRLRLEGSFAGAPITAVLVQRGESQFPLLRARFSWVSD